MTSNVYLNNSNSVLVYKRGDQSQKTTTKNSQNAENIST